MRITENTKYYEVAGLLQYLTPIDEIRLVFASENYYLGESGWWGMRIGDFIKLLQGDLSIFGVDKDNAMDVPAFAHFIMKGFAIFMQDFCQTCKALDVPMTANEQRAQSKCLQMGVDEGILVFCRNYFSLPNFDAVADLPLSDYLLARKDSYNKTMFEKSYQENFFK